MQEAVKSGWSSAGAALAAIVSAIADIMFAIGVLVRKAAPQHPVLAIISAMLVHELFPHLPPEGKALLSGTLIGAFAAVMIKLSEPAPDPLVPASVVTSLLHAPPKGVEPRWFTLTREKAIVLLVGIAAVLIYFLVTKTSGNVQLPQSARPASSSAVSAPAAEDGGAATQSRRADRGRGPLDRATDPRVR